MKRIRRWATLVTALAFGTGAGVAACSSGSSDDSGANGNDSGQSDTSLVDAPVVPDDGSPIDTGIVDAGPTAKETACESYVNAFCTRWTTCGYYGCPAQTGQCPDLLFASGAGMTTSDVPACVTALADASCVDLANNNGPDACQKPGTRTAGQACAVDRQCASMKCYSGDSYHCGFCESTVPEGGDCTQAYATCPPGQYCDYPVYGGTDICKSPVPGTGCNVIGPTYQYCPPGLSCLRGPSDPINFGACKLPPQPGQLCAINQGDTYPYCPGNAQCDVTDAASGAGTCMGYMPLGQACGRQGDGFFVECANGNCDIPDGGTTGTCVPYRTLGESCGSTPTTYFGCDPTTACEVLVVGQPHQCVPRFTKGQTCGDTPERYADGGDSGIMNYIDCVPGQVCTNNPCYFSEGAPAQTVCVPSPGVVGDDCGYGSCSQCESWLACSNHKCTTSDLSTCN